MKFGFAVAAALLLAFTATNLTHGRMVPPIDFSHPKIKAIDAAKFKETIAKGIWLVEWFAPRCSHCQEFQPHMIKAVEKHYGLGETHDFHFAHVDCRANRDFCEEQSVDTFPAIYIFVDGERKTEYMGSFNFAGLEQFIQESVKKYFVPAKNEAISETQDAKAEAKVVATTPKADENNAPQTTTSSPNPPLAPAVNALGREITLGNDDFKELTRKGPWMIKFFAPWCGHCQHLAPIWEEFAKQAKGLVNVGSVDCTIHSALCADWKVAGYPTLKFFIDGVFVSDYRGSKTLELLLQHAKSMTETVVKSIKVSDLDVIKKEREVNFVYLSADSDGEMKVPAVLELLARQNKELCALYKSNDPELFEGYALSQQKTHLILLRDEEAYRFSGDDFEDLERVQRWFNSHKFPSLVQLTSANANELFNQRRYVALVFFDSSKPRLQEQVDRLKQISKTTEPRLQPYVQYAWIDGVKWAKYCRSVFGIELRDTPTAVVVHPNGDEFFDRTNDGLRFEVTEEGLTSALEASMKNELRSTSINGFFGSLEKFASTIANNWMLTIVIIGAVVSVLYWFSRDEESRSRSAKAD